MWTALEPSATTVDPGSTASVRLRVRNTGDTVEEYRLQVVGDAAGWARVEPDMLRLYPGAEATAEVTLAPPRTPDAQAGPTPFGVRVRPREAPHTADVVEGQVTVGPFTELRTELLPLVVRGRLRAKASVAVDNLGNQQLTASFSGRENGEELEVEAEPGSVQVAPGRAGFAELSLKPGAVSWVGGTQKHPFTVSVLRAGVPDPVELRGTYVQPSVFPRWVMAVFSVLVALAVAAAVMWFQHKPNLATQAREKPGKQQQLPQGDAMKPAPSPKPSPSKEEKKEEEPAPPDEKKDDASKSKPGGGGEQKDDEPEGPTTHTIRSAEGSGWYLEVKQGKDADGTYVGQNPSLTDEFGKNQDWILHHYPESDSYSLEPAHAPGTVLDQKVNTNIAQIVHASPENIKSGQLPGNQKWKLEKRDDGLTRIVAVGSGECLVDMQNDTSAVTWKCDDRKSMGWTISDWPE
ncbi:hydrogenase expression protein [Streptomyces sp. WAC 01529]|uniref:hydrogenase expression protein n=1 Tax=Streptomyces sp. WAC 01529 TaxID=2203205 RepID=UPI000F706C58|nr:hydrogenase expression protein [Streptomyces sp. WAC 01529]AZM56070.1 hydrogenase expression protein [Streptomyces sp. WAC 01529]